MKNKMYSILMVAAILLLTILLFNLMKQRSQLRTLNVEVEDLKTKVSVLELKAKVLKVEIDLVKVGNYRKIVKGWNNENEYYQILCRKINERIKFKDNRDGNLKALKKDEDEKNLTQARLNRNSLFGYPGAGI